MLRNTVESARTINQVGAVHSDNLTVRKNVAQNRLRLFIVCVIERRYENDAIPNQEIRIARREPLLLAADRIEAGGSPQSPPRSM